MGTFLVYSLQSSICLAAFYLFYKLLLSRDTFHRFNRFALIDMIVLSAALPWLAILLIPVQSLAVESVQATPEISDFIPPLLSAYSSPNRLLSAILLIYISGCAVFLLRSIWTVYRILRLIRKGHRTKIINNISLTVHTDGRIAPFSWMNNIVVSQTDMNESGDTILLHEQAHIRRRHTLDLMLAELCIIFQWYNPAAWLLYRELQHVHEYEADQSVLNQGINAKQYQLLLIKKAVGTRRYSLANSLNHSNLIKRITMMLQKKSSSWARLKYTYVLPLAAISLIAFARPEISQHFDGISNAKVSNLLRIADPPGTIKNEFAENPVEVVSPMLQNPDVSASQQVGDTTVYNIVDENPTFQAEDIAAQNYLALNVRYPVKAQEAGIQGRIPVQFIVEKDGSLSNIQISNDKKIDPELDAEAIRVISSMPKWNPGKLKGNVVRVRFTLPVNFRLMH
ncbi:MAG: M56 family metallopeptidase [Tannerella sp.]|jgi:TonB family protein|nr:M56 family metallopeptidase [Tannerella sp.]